MEILGIYNDRVWNKEIFSDAQENSKDSNVSFDVKKLLCRNDQNVMLIHSEAISS